MEREHIHVKFVTKALVSVVTIQCTVCDKTFSAAASFKWHITPVHGGERDHQCKVCDKTFSAAASFRLHITSVHGGERVHQCKVCDKTFSAAGSW